MNPTFWHGYLSFCVALLGAAVGSFLNVCIYRIPREESIIRPPSHCPRCGGGIAWFDNIPLLSWIVLRGRCRHCGGPISLRYPMVEALTALLFWAIWRRYGWDVRTPVYWVVASGLVLGSFVDLDHLIIPDRVTIGGMATGLVFSALFPALHRADAWLHGLSRAVLGMVVGLAVLWIIAELGRLWFKKEAMGLGDVKLLGAIGAYLGWSSVVFTLVLSSFIGSLAGLGLILVGGRDWQSRIPYGPFLALGAIVWILGGDSLWYAYLHWLFPPPM